MNLNDILKFDWMNSKSIRFVQEYGTNTKKKWDETKKWETSRAVAPFQWTLVLTTFWTGQLCRPSDQWDRCQWVCCDAHTDTNTQTHTDTHIHTHTQTHTVWRSLKSHQMEIWRKAFNSLATVRAFLSLNVARPAPLAVLAAPITRSLTTANDALWRRPEVASAPLFDEFRRFSFTFNIPALNWNNTNWGGFVELDG